MNWIDVLVIVVCVIIVDGIIAIKIIRFKRDKITCNCAQAKRIKRNLKQCRKEIEKEKRNHE